MTLYLKYRPQRISELDLVDVREFLSKIVSSKDIPHAFLFEGPRGSGKTSAARIIAKVLNCTHLSKNNEPCNKCDQCISITKGTNIDVIELDAASHRGIEDVRLIRESVKLAPARAKKKVYIIDEAHMLTTEASNALLKTLEEPPEHVVFILATTNSEKLLDTIKSRTVRVKFKKATKEEIYRSLENVLKTEKKKFKKEVLELIARNVDGSFRDAKKILEELLLKGLLNDLKKAQDYILNRGDFNVDDFFVSLTEKNLKNCVKYLSKADDAGVPSKAIYTQIVEKLKGFLFLLVESGKDTIEGFTKSEILSLSDIFISFWNRYQNDVSEYMPFYLSAVKWCSEGVENNGEKSSDLSKQPSNNTKSTKEASKSSLNETLKNGNQHLVSNHDGQNGEKVEFILGDDKNTHGIITNGDSQNATFPAINLDEGENIDQNLSDEIWKRILGLIRTKNASTEALLRASKPYKFDGKKLILGVYYKFHKEKLESYPHRLFLEDCIKTVVGESVKVECFLTSPEEVIKKEVSEDLVGGGINQEMGKDKTTNGVLLSETDESDLMKLVDEVFGT